MLVTRIAYSKGLTASKLAHLSEMALRLGGLRTLVWEKFGSLQGVVTSHRAVRDSWLTSRRKFDVPARVWKETLRDVFGDIEAYRACAMRKTELAICRHTKDKNERQRLKKALKDGSWVSDHYLRSRMRKYYRHGHTEVKNQIILDAQCYRWFEFGGKGWIEVTSLVPRKRLAIPLNTTQPITGTIRLILRSGCVEVHYTVNAESCCNNAQCGGVTLGIDRGYSEVFMDSDGTAHAEGLGELLSAESDFLKVKYQRRQKLKAIADKKPHKADRIRRNNLGRKKLNLRKAKHRANVKAKIYRAAHTVVDKAKTIVSEDLTAVIKSKKNHGRNQLRRLSGWVKGLIADALTQVSSRRGAAVVLVNSAYTSQACSCCGCLGTRKGDTFYCTIGCGVVLHADHNAALNVLARFYDTEISRWTPYQQVKSILLERQRRRVGLLTLDSSRTAQAVLAESELPSLVNNG